MARIISVITQKGGVGKTTTVNALAAALNKHGRRVLCIDMDPQSNLSFSLKAETEDSYTIYDAMRKDVSTLDCIQRSPTADIIPSDILLNALEMEYTGINREFLLKEALESVKNLYDYILIDSPPSLGILTANVLSATRYVILPTLPDIFSLQGLTKVHETIEHTKKACNPRLEIAGILINRYNKHFKLHKEAYGTAKLLADKFEIPVFNTVIRNCKALSEAHSLQCDITKYKKSAKGIKDFQLLTQELMDRGIF
ncbi:MAG: ParA family protein [Oscillospiraceae bacterium]|nr:ParA family protein [Oscillospiraceae bacterium]